jgi:type IV secretory pathway TrbL component
MKTIDKDELYRHLCEFLKSKGVELKEGSYTQRIRQGCTLLTDAANTTRKTVKRAKVKADQKLDDLRQSIHEATAPASASSKPSAAAPSQERGKGRRRTPAARAKARPRK